MAARRPILVIGYGNPGRGDDAAGPLLVERLEAALADGALPPYVDTVTALQLMIEHADDLNDRRLAVFVDASTSAAPPFQLTRVRAARDLSYTSHEMSPAALLEVQRRAFGDAPSEAWLMAIPGETFALGAEMSATTRRHVDAAYQAITELIDRHCDQRPPCR